MTPAEVLAAAADKLDALITEAAPDWQLSESNHLALPLIEMPYMNGMLKGQPGYTVSGPNDATTFYIAAMNPLVGSLLAQVLRRFADACERDSRPTHDQWSRPQRVDDRIPGLTAALDLARLIVGGESCAATRSATSC